MNYGLIMIDGAPSGSVIQGQTKISIAKTDHVKSSSVSCFPNDLLNKDNLDYLPLNPKTMKRPGE